MTRRFSKWWYFVNCVLTLFMTGLISATFFDISNSAYTFGLPLHPDPRAGLNPTTTPSNDPQPLTTSSTAPNWAAAFPPREPHRLLFESLAQEGGYSGHMVDIFVWVYVITLVVAMTHKYITYRIQGFHYFFLDYCYFHNALLVCFLLRLLVVVRWSEVPLLSFRPVLDKFTWVGPAFLPKWTRGWFLFFLNWDGLYYPVSADLLTCGYVAANLSQERLIPLLVVFVALLAGSFGPVLGAIPMWRNALTFSSFDRMSSVYLHLMPGIIQAMFLDCFFTSARRKIAVVLRGFVAPGIGVFAKQTLNATWRNPREGLAGVYHPQNPLHALCDDAFCLGLAQFVSYQNMLWLHFVMFCVWQVFYHLFHEIRRYQRKRKLQSRQRTKRLRRMRELLRLFRSTHFRGQVVPSGLSNSNLLNNSPHASASASMRHLNSMNSTTSEMNHAAGGVKPSPDPFHRVTAYTWMMVHPPGGANGWPYRFVTCLGTGRLPTTVLFELCQWVLHVFFFTLSYGMCYLSFYVTFSVGPLLVLIGMYTAICVYNAALAQARQINRLQSALEGAEAMLASTKAAVPNNYSAP